MKNNFCRWGDILSKHWQIWQCPLSFIYKQIGKGEEREIHLKIYCVLRTLKTHHLIFFSLILTLRDKYCFCFTNKQLLMPRKRKYFAYICHKWKNKGMIWTLVVLKSPYSFFASHFILIGFSHVFFQISNIMLKRKIDLNVELEKGGQGGPLVLPLTWIRTYLDDTVWSVFSLVGLGLWSHALATWLS